MTQDSQKPVSQVSLFKDGISHKESMLKGVLHNGVFGKDGVEKSDARKFKQSMQRSVNSDKSSSVSSHKSSLVSSHKSSSLSSHKSSKHSSQSLQKVKSPQE